MSNIDWTIRLDAPTALTAGGILIALIVLCAILAVRRSGAITATLSAHLNSVTDAVRALDQSQHRLAGGLNVMAETQAAGQARTIEQVERRLEEVQRAMGETLHGSSTRTARSLGELQQRLETIDKAQTNMEKLSGDVLGLQDILANKQARGAFGEIQLNEIIGNAFPPDAYTLQATLSNGRRVDCLIHLPAPPGPVAVDAKFPLEPWEAWHCAENSAERKAAARSFRTAMQTHIRAIAERYIIAGETADGAMMFLPSEAVYATLHADFGDVVRQGFEARVWIVSPTTLMAVLNTMRAVLRDARLRDHAAELRRELGLLTRDLARLGDRVGNLDRHMNMAAQDIDEIRTS
ncbi:MAG: DNA recombination protein RmuC, partial [Pseudomonadota bacterium]